MLLWLPSTHSATLDEDEKGAKLRRRASARARFANTLLGAGVLLMVVAVLTVRTMHRAPKTRGAIRRAAASLLLPPNSIYRLHVADGRGATASLLQYAGAVSLVVNTACR